MRICVHVCFRTDREPLRDGDELPSYDLGKQHATCVNITLTFVSCSRIIKNVENCFRYCLFIVVLAALSYFLQRELLN